MLTSHLIRHIETHGPMDVGTYMTLALGHPEYGYYMRRDPFGVAGDFTTAPEISQMFGEMLGAWAADFAMRRYGADSIALLELGPGRGTLMADALRSIKGVKGLEGLPEVHLLEISPTLKTKQRDALRNVSVRWHETIDSIARDKPLIVMANEFLDALPVRQLQFDGRGWQERVIGLSEGKTLSWGLRAAAPELIRAIPYTNRQPRTGDIAEISPARLHFMRNLFDLLKSAGGAALFIDYGYETFGYGDTVQAVRGHDYCGIFDHPGEADISAHVDFSALVRLAEEEGIACYGLVEQGAFLHRLGIGLRAQALQRMASPGQREEIEKALRRLTNSDEMGRLFKVIGFSYGPGESPAGF